ncbi:MAG: hypothetical protein PVH05_02530 [Burkholderiales bacterium]|jgi:hypothetical protein
MKAKAAVTIAFLSFCIIPFAQNAHAESGTIKLEARCHVETKHSHVFGDQTIKYYEQLCAITNTAGSGFMDKVSMFGPAWSEASKSSTRLIGYNVIVDADNDQLYLSISRHGVPPHQSVGQWTITGGTGKYEGATGGGTYDLTWLPQVVDGSFLNIATLNGQYHLP